MKNNKKRLQFGQTDLEGIIAGLMRQLEQLAPHPDQNFHLAPLFTSTAEGNVITAVFNSGSLYMQALDAYNRDLPTRRRILSRIAACRRLLASMRVYIPSAPELAVA